MEGQLPVQVVYGHIRQGAKGAVDAANNLVHHAAQLLVLRDVCAARHSNLGTGGGEAQEGCLCAR